MSDSNVVKRKRAGSSTAASSSSKRPVSKAATKQLQQQLMYVIDRDDLQGFIALSQNNRHFDRHMRLPAEVFSAYTERDRMGYEQHECRVDYTNDPGPGPRPLRTIGVTTWNLLRFGLYNEVTHMPLLYYAACAMAQNIVRYCFDTLLVDPNMDNFSDNGTVCQALASVAPGRLLSNLPGLYRTMQLLLEHDASPWELVVTRAPLVQQEMWMGRVYPVYIDQHTRQCFESLSHVYHSRYMFVGQHDVSTRMHPNQYNRFSCISSYKYSERLLDVRSVDCSSTGAMCELFSSRMSRDCIEGPTRCSEEILAASRRENLLTPHLFPESLWWVPQDIEAQNKEGALWLVGKHAVILIKDDFQEQEKHSLLALWHMNIRWPLVLHLRALHNMQRTSKCSFTTLIGRDWNVRSAFVIRIVAQWLSVVRPNYPLLWDRVKATEPHWSMDEKLHIPFVGFSDVEFRLSFARVFRSNKTLRLVVALWCLKDIESKDPSELQNLYALQQLPLEMLWYLLDAWWIENLQCECWSAQRHRPFFVRELGCKIFR